MDTLQKGLDSLLSETLSTKKISALLIAKRLKEMGISLTDRQLRQVEDQLQGSEGELTITFEDPCPGTVGVEFSPAALDGLQLDLGDARALDDLLDEVGGRITAAIPEIVSECSELLLAQLKSDAPSMLRDHERVRRRFETGAIRQAWGPALDLLQTLAVIAHEAGEDFNSEFRPQAAQDRDYVFDVLTRLHARACQIASEVMVLLRSGYADGAHARWRALHEVAVVAFFVAERGNDTAERYLLHDVVESYKRAKEYGQHCEALGYPPLPEEQLKGIEDAYKAALDRFGRDYAGQYGWASAALGKARPTFADIEAGIGMEQYRPFYGMASHNVHANPKGVLFRLGAPPSGEELLLSGASVFGLADPGHDTAISLAQVTTALLMTRPNLDRIVICSVMKTLADEIGDALIATARAHGESLSS